MNIFNLRTIVASIVMVVATAASNCAQAQQSDRVQIKSGVIQGRIRSISPREITVETSGKSITTSVHEVENVRFGGEPPELTQARWNVDSHQYQRALDGLAKIDQSTNPRAEVVADIKFYTAFCRAQLAIGGQSSRQEAIRQMLTFVQQNSSSHHYYPATELLADLLVASDRFQDAEKVYAELAKAPWEDYQLRAARLIGQTQLAQEKYSDAIAAFERVEQATPDDEDSKHQKMLAHVGKAICLAETGQAAEAVKILEGVIQEVDEAQLEYFALAYNALGRCYKKAGQPQDAVLAYLHVDILCSKLPGPHAEALAQLAPLWREIGQPERAAETAARLQSLYPDSRWAKQEVR